MANVYIYGPLTLWLVAQLIKFIINLVRGRGDVRYLISSGGMPSAHAAVVCSLATIALLDSGIDSPIFGVTAVMAAIVMYDSFGVRRSSGEQARVLNRLVGDLKDNRVLRNSADYKTLREILGHKPHEVFAGAVLGIVGGLLFVNDKIGDRFKFLTAPLTTSQMMWFGYGFVALLVIIIIKWLYLRSQFGRNKATRRSINRLLLYCLAGVAWLALVLFSSYQSIMVVQTCGIALLSWAVVLITLGWLVFNTYQKLKQQKTQVESTARRDKWLTKAKKK